MDINDVGFDKCRQWIEVAIKKGLSWDEVLFLRKKNEEEAEKALENNKIEHFWPEELNFDLWEKIVKFKKEIMDKEIAFKENSLKAIITDSSEDNELGIPTDRNSSWQLYKKHLLNNGFSKLSVNLIEESTEKTLKRLSKDTRLTGPIKGLVIGNVQSGKTANMAALMAMTADHGWNFFIVLSGTIEKLRQQTQNRIYGDLKHSGILKWYGLEHLTGRNIKNSSLDNNIRNKDFSEGSDYRYFTVCLKNKTRLENLIQWINKDQNKKKQMKILVIDDEADQAGINTEKILNEEELKYEDQERKAINRLIVNLVEGKNEKGEETEYKYKAMNYISYTATPYANFLNEIAEDSLYPKNFIATLPQSNEYFGPQQIFGSEINNEMPGLDIVRYIADDEIKTIKNIHKGKKKYPPESLQNAIIWLLLAASVLRKQGYKRPVSMLIHTSHLQKDHKMIADVINRFFELENKEKIKEMAQKMWDEERNRLTPEKLRKSYFDFASERELKDLPKFNDIEENLEKILEEKISHVNISEDGNLNFTSGIHMAIDNCSFNGISDEGDIIRLTYPEESLGFASIFMVIGGATLSRGLTIEGLVSTYFARETAQADSLMQMGRWFGYRKNYELLPRIWMSELNYNRFLFLSDLDHELRNEIQNFEITKQLPSEYGPRVKNTPKASWLRITAKNKMQSSTEVNLDFSGTINQTIFFHNALKILDSNIEVAENFLTSLKGPKKSLTRKGSYVWENVDFSMIRENFLKKYKVHERSRVLNDMEALYEWIEKVGEDKSLKGWNVVLAGLSQKNSDESKIWELPFGKIVKVERTRNKASADKDYIDIRALLSPGDLLADITEEKMLKVFEQEMKRQSGQTNKIRHARENLGLEKTPIIIIYRIDKDTKADGGNRVNLNALQDLIGFAIHIPGSKNLNLARSLTIKIPDSSLKESFYSDDEN